MNVRRIVKTTGRLAAWTVLLSIAWHDGPAAQQAESKRSADTVVHGDWYRRESLRAIDDWERLLARTDADRQPFTFPVPIDGREAVWPQPAPASLLPKIDRAARLRLQFADNRIVVRQPAASWRDAATELLDSGAEMRGYHHPGGGGKDRWGEYHRFDRRFDRLMDFHPVAAPLAVELPETHDFSLGENRLPLTLHNIAGEQLRVAVDVDLIGPETADDRSLASREVDLPPGANTTIDVPVRLDAPGGRMIVVALSSDDAAYRIPLLTHVGDAPAVLEGIAQILADHPDEGGFRELDRLRACAATLLADPASNAGDAWRAVFEQAHALRDRLLLARIRFDRLLLVKRKPYTSEQPFMDGHHKHNPPGGGIYCLAPVRPDGELTTVVDSLGEGIYRDVCLHWDADRVLFAFGNGSDDWDGRQSYDLYELPLGGGQPRRLTDSVKNDCEPIYLPDGRIGFTSDRAEHFVMCGGDIHATHLFSMRPDGSDVRQLSHNVFNEFNPAVLPNGQIIYNRWEYNERSVTSLHDLFTIRPDGTHAAPYYGNATIRPNVIMFPRPVPGSSKITALFTPHHGQTFGTIGLIDVRRGIDGPAPVTLLTPGVPVAGEHVEDSRSGWFSDPRPLSEDTYLCSFTPTVRPWLDASWSVYVGDRHGNLALVWRDAGISCFEPLPLAPTPRPHRLPEVDVDTGPSPNATLLLADVYEGLTGVPRGEARFLRILEDVPRQGVPTGGVIVTGDTSVYTVKRIIGTVPIEHDGSAHFSAPAGRNLYFEALDANRREIQRMRSVVCLRPGERRTCIGCHEPRQQAPPARVPLAFGRSPSSPQPAPWGLRTISFLRDVQPVLDAKCVACHAHDRASCGVILTGDLTDQFNIAYEELLPYLSLANAMRWDHPDDVLPRPPYTYGSNASRLVTLLAEGHHDVQLTAEQWERLVLWIDTNGIYFDRYECNWPNRRIFTGEVASALSAVHQSRCAKCHEGDGRFDTWALSLNRRDVGRSRMLQAPLARAAGGRQLCAPVVFADTSDPDYQRLLTTLTQLHATLTIRPRADLAEKGDILLFREK